MLYRVSGCADVSFRNNRRHTSLSTKILDLLLPICSHLSIEGSATMTAVMITGVCLIAMAFNAVNCLPFVNLCPKMDSMQDFDIRKFQGFWYEVMRVPFNGPLATKCNTETYTILNGSHVDITAHFVEIGSNRNLNTVGKAVIDAKTPSVLKFNFPEVEATGDFKVLSTDYENYAVMYRCKTIEIFKIEMAWVLSRTPELREDIRNNILNQYQQMGGNPGEILYVDHANC